MRMYDYLVYYTCKIEGYVGPCTGTMNVSRKKKVTNFDELESLRQFVMESIKGASNLSVNTITLLGRNKH